MALLPKNQLPKWLKAKIEKENERLAEPVDDTDEISKKEDEQPPTALESAKNLDDKSSIKGSAAGSEGKLSPRGSQHESVKSGVRSKSNERDLVEEQQTKPAETVDEPPVENDL